MPTTKARAKALKSCPFCGGSWVITHRPANGSQPYISCKECNASGPLTAGMTEAQWRAAWNTRASEANDATLAEFEAFRRKVSDKAEVVKKLHPTAACYLGDLILPKPVDPLVEAIREASVSDADDGDASRLRAALAKRGLKLVEVGDAD